ncbi:MAG TPA: GerMN domain-containing protein [Vicinamibacterales bacterium]|nr:GerMN domain-containing protein [Vicinamibacterales bacterium]
MTQRRALVVVAVLVVAAVVGALLYTALPRRYRATPGNTVSAAPSTAPAPPGRKIKARLFYVAQDGTHLTGVEREIAYGEGAVAQAREIVAAQVAPVAEPLVSAVPAGTSLRALFISDKGDAYVDFSHELVSSHPGGTTSELLTVYTIVDALAANLPAVRAVQILVDGKEVDTLAGHIDLRQPIEKNLEFIQ